MYMLWRDVVEKDADKVHCSEFVHVTCYTVHMDSNSSLAIVCMCCSMQYLVLWLVQ